MFFPAPTSARPTPTHMLQSYAPVPSSPRPAPSFLPNPPPIFAQPQWSQIVQPALHPPPLQRPTATAFVPVSLPVPSSPAAAAPSALVSLENAARYQLGKQRRKCYKDIRLLGTGAEGIVRLCESELGRVAVKVSCFPRSTGSTQAGRARSGPIRREGSKFIFPPSIFEMYRLNSLSPYVVSTLQFFRQTIVKPPLPSPSDVQPGEAAANNLKVKLLIREKAEKEMRKKYEVGGSDKRGRLGKDPMFNSSFYCRP